MLCKVQPIAKKGRGLVAVRNIRIGECILEEEPLVYCGDGSVAAYLALMAFMTLCAIVGLDASSILSALASAGVLGLTAVVIAVLWEIGALNEEILSRLDRALRVSYAVFKLGKDQRRRYLDMCGKQGYLTPIGRCVGIFDLSSLSTGHGASSVFPTLCMLNHACTGNANPSWHVDKRRALVHAVKPIREGEEITFCYAESFDTRKERQFDLQERWQFECACAVCSATGTRQSASDLRRTQCKMLLDNVRQKAAAGQDAAALEDAESLLATVDEEFGSAIEKTELCVMAYQVAGRVTGSGGDPRLEVKWAAAAHCYYAITRGPTHPDVRLLARALSAVPEAALEKLAAKCGSMPSKEFLLLCEQLPFAQDNSTQNDCTEGGSYAERLHGKSLPIKRD